MTWLSILLSAVTALLLIWAFAGMLANRRCASNLVYTVVIFGLVGMVALCAVLFVVLGVWGSSSEYFKIWWALLGTFSAIALLIFALNVCYNWDELLNAVMVVRCSDELVAENKQMWWVPLLHMLLHLLVFYGGYYLYIFTLSWSDQSLASSKASTWTVWNVLLTIVMVLGQVWAQATVSYLNNFVIISAVATFYFDNARQASISSADVGKAWRLTYFNHFGSNALGAFILYPVYFFRTLCTLGQELETENIFVNNTRTTGFQRTCRCAHWTNANVFNYIAVTGDGFCHGGWENMLLRSLYFDQVTYAAHIASVFVSFSKVGLIAINVGVFLIISEFIISDMKNAGFIFGPCLAVAFLTYYIASDFLALLDESVSSILTCMAIDIHANGQRQYGPPMCDDFQDATTGKLGGMLSRQRITGETVGPNYYGSQPEGGYNELSDLQ